MLKTMKKVQNSRGFAVAETILILAIVGLIGIVGWYVWHSKQNAEKALDVSSSAKYELNSAEKYGEGKTVDGVYTNTKLGFTFKFPSTWGVKRYQLSEGDREAIEFRTADYAEVKDSSAFHGAFIQVRAFIQEDYQDLDEYITKAEGIGSPGPNVKHITVDNIPALRKDECGDSNTNGTCVDFFREKIHYQIWCSYPDEESTAKSTYIKDFNALLASIHFD
jgi:hypothetical protein